MNKFYLLSISCAALMASACDHYSTKLASMDASQQAVANISPAAGGEMTFSQYLASEYYQLARYEQDYMYDYKAAKYYTEKAEALSQGQMVAPASLKTFQIKPDNQEELARAREELINALKTYNIAENRYSLAMAQSRYDCWVEQQAESNPNSDVQTCKNEFRHAISTLVPPDHHEVRIAVPFDKGSMVLSEEARISLGRTLSFWNNNKVGGYKLSLQTATETSADEASRQISMVRSILQFNGIPASEISVSEDSQSPSEMFEILLVRQKSTDSVGGHPDI